MRFLFLFFAVFTVFAVPAFAEKVNSIKIQGGQRIQESTIRSYIPLQTGQEYTKDDLDKSL